MAATKPASLARRWLPWIAAGLLGLLLVWSALGTSASLAPETVGECPLMPWETSNPQIFLGPKEARTYFCCGRCRRDWLLADPLRLRGALSRAARLGDDLDRLLGGEYCRTIAPPPGGAVPGHGRTGWMGYLGRFHPASVHFPIAFLLLAAFAELGFMYWGDQRLRDGARFNLAAAAMAAPITVGLGWCAGGWATAYPGDLTSILRFHKWAGTAVAGATLIAAALSEANARRDNEDLAGLYRMALILAAILVSAAGYLGGLLVYGPEHYL